VRNQGNWLSMNCRALSSSQKMCVYAGFCSLHELNEYLHFSGIVVVLYVWWIIRGIWNVLVVMLCVNGTFWLMDSLRLRT